jgi:hypothetical protein
MTVEEVLQELVDKLQAGEIKPTDQAEVTLLEERNGVWWRRLPVQHEESAW